MSYKDFQTGIADFVVLDTEQKLSKSGNQMTVLKLKLTDQNGNVIFLLDFFPEMEKMFWKHESFKDSIYGDNEELKKQTPLVPILCKDQQGQCEVQWKKNEAGPYEWSLAVKKYIKYTPKTEKTITNEPFYDDHVPF